MAQGATVDQTFMLATPGMDRHLSYVGMTRHREGAGLYAGRDDTRRLRPPQVKNFVRQAEGERGREKGSDRIGNKGWGAIRPTLKGFLGGWAG
jgi:ATP-dependent exoDNAse (exonuclease V) alpha subunit